MYSPALGNIDPSCFRLWLAGLGVEQTAERIRAEASKLQRIAFVLAQFRVFETLAESICANSTHLVVLSAATMQSFTTQVIHLGLFFAVVIVVSLQYHLTCRLLFETLFLVSLNLILEVLQHRVLLFYLYSQHRGIIFTKLAEFNNSTTNTMRESFKSCLVNV